MATYVQTTDVLVVAYKIGDANPPDWFTAAVAADKLVPRFAPNSYCINQWLFRHKDGDMVLNIGDYVIYHAPTGVLSTMAAALFEGLYEEEAAELITVMGVAPETTTGTGTVEDPIVWNIPTDNANTVFPIVDVVVSQEATYEVYTDAALETEAGAQIALTAEVAATVYIAVTSASEEITTVYAVSITRAAA